MKEILHKWLYDCLGLSIKMEDIGHEMKDGVILAKLLRHYQVVNEKTIKYIVPTENPLACENNLRQLNVWFQLLGIKVDNDTFYDIANGKTTTGLHILYELYLSLHNKEQLYFINTRNHMTYLKKRSKIANEFLVRCINSDSYQRLHERSDDLATDTQRTSRLYQYTEKLKELGKRKGKEESSKIKSQMLNKKGHLEKERMRIEDIIYVKNKLDFSPFHLSDIKKDKNFLATESQPTDEKERKSKLQSKIVDPFKSTTKECENLILDSVMAAIENKDKEQFKKQISHNLLREAQYEKQISSKAFQQHYQEKINREKFLETKQKIQEESKNLTFFSSCKTSEEEINYQLEMIKKMEMHKKLYAEKLKRRHRKHYAICTEITNDIVDLAIKKSNFGKESVTDEIWSRWKQMFVLGQPILELAENEERKTENFSIIEKDIPTQYSEDSDFEEYLHLVGNWIEHAGLDVTFDEENILGYIVHRLFDIKYPPPFIQKPAELVKHKICAILYGINEDSEIIKLKTLLIKSKIFFVDVKSAINFCIKCYKFEADIKEEKPSSKKGKKTETPKAKTSKPDDSKNTKKGSSKKGHTEIIREDKEVQTTSSLLSTNEVKELSSAAIMGNYLYGLETLDDIPSPIIVEVLVEFLKVQTNINGWVLVNFPCTLKEAYIIEKTLSGKKFPKTFKQKLSITNLSSLQVNGSSIECCDKYKRKKSRIVQRPPNKFDNFQTYFTSFILVTEGKTEPPDDSTSKKNYHATSISEITKQDTDSEIPEENEIITLTAIYDEQGIFRKFVYETMDLHILKKIARLIAMGLKSAEEIPSTELFGEESLQFLEKIADPKNKKSPKKTKEDPEETYEILKQSMLTDETQHVGLSETDIDEKSQQLSESDLMTKPGQIDWVYTEFNIPEDMAISLATSWEEMEYNYIEKVKEILNKMRSSENLISLYITYITQAMREHFEECNESQNLVNEFLNNFNSVPIKRRSEKETKDQLSCRVFHLEMKLWEIANDRKIKAEERRKYLINQNWTVEEMVQIASTFISFLRIEADRCISTILLLHNYYSLMSGSQATDFLQNISLPEAKLNNECKEKQELNSTILKVLTDESNINLSNPLYNIIEDIFKQFRTEINKLKTNLITVIVNHEQQTLDKINEHKDKVKAESKKGKLKKSENDNDETPPLLAESKYTDIKNMFLEWSYVVKNECDRTNCRMAIIMKKTKTDLEKLEKNMTTLFHNIYNEIKLNYLKQNECIDKVCKIIHAAINENTPVLCDIVFYQNYVFTEPDQLIDILIQPIQVPLEEEIRSQCFTINQLKYISERLKLISPNGKMNKNALAYILEDLIFWEQEKENIQLFPKIWNEMNSVDFDKLFTIVFGFTDLVNWKDLIIYSLELRFPEMEDIINCRIQFNSYDKENKEIISYNDFMNIKLWFEDENENGSEIQIQATKQFLFSLFQINETFMNYSEFILAFCKDNNQKIGFGKGLAYFLGKCVIVSGKELYLEDTLRDHSKQQNDMMREILNQVIFDVVNNAGLRIEEIDNSIDETNQPQNEGNNNTSQNSQSTNHSAIRESLQQNITKESATKDDEEKEFLNILYNKEMQNEEDQSQISITEKEENQSADKASQTIPLSQLMYDEYIKVSKVLQWTSEVPKSVVNSLLEEKVYTVLQSKLYEKETEYIIWKMKRALAVTEDEFIYIPWLMEQNIMQDIFSYVHSFKIFSFPSIIKGIRENQCN